MEIIVSGGGNSENHLVSRTRENTQEFIQNEASTSRAPSHTSIESRDVQTSHPLQQSTTAQYNRLSKAISITQFLEETEGDIIYQDQEPSSSTPLGLPTSFDTPENNDDMFEETEYFPQPYIPTRYVAADNESVLEHVARGKLIFFCIRMQN